LQALAFILGYKLYDEEFEDAWWYFEEKRASYETDKNTLEHDQTLKTVPVQNVFEFKTGGFYGIRDNDSLTTIRCGSYKDRPAQADALHLDIWYKGINVLFDPGTYKYNTDAKYIHFYHGTGGHNSLTIGDHNQMKKGLRFVWNYWTQAVEHRMKDSQSAYEFEGKIKAFREVGKNIVHHRKVIKYKGLSKWTVIDKISGYTGKEPIIQHWNISDLVEGDEADQFRISVRAFDKQGNALKKQYVTGWNSEKYGILKEFEQLIFKTEGDFIETHIEIKDL
jgi:hypothetical protein